MEKKEEKSGSFYVEVQDKRKICFPRRCIVCGKNVDNSMIEFPSNPVGFFGGFIWQLGLSKKISIPAHRACGLRLKRNNLFRNISLFSLATITLVIGIYLDLSRWQVYGLLLVLLIPPVYWQEKNTPPFEFRLEDEIYEFRFADKEYAQEFADLNGVSIKK